MQRNGDGQMRGIGVLSREEFGGMPVYRFETRTGGTYQIRGQVPPELVGPLVSVIATASPMSISVGMVGPALDLVSIERAPESQE